MSRGGEADRPDEGVGGEVDWSGFVEDLGRCEEEAREVGGAEFDAFGCGTVEPGEGVGPDEIAELGGQGEEGACWAFGMFGILGLTMSGEGGCFSA